MSNTRIHSKKLLRDLKIAGIPYKPEGYHYCYIALDALQICKDITQEEYDTIKAMLDSSDQENLAMAEMVLAKKYEKVIIIKKKKS